MVLVVVPSPSSATKPEANTAFSTSRGPVHDAPVAPASFRPPAAGDFLPDLPLPTVWPNLVCNRASRVWTTSCTTPKNRHRNTASRASSMACNCSGETTSSNHRSLTPTFPFWFGIRLQRSAALRATSSFWAGLRFKGPTSMAWLVSGNSTGYVGVAISPVAAGACPSTEYSNHRRAMP